MGWGNGISFYGGVNDGLNLVPMVIWGDEIHRWRQRTV